MIEIIQNLALLAALSVMSGFIGHRWPHRMGDLCQGLTFGLVAVVGMITPLELVPGLIFDGRSVVISLCALYFGPLSASVACAMAIGCRLEQGGVGTATGIAVILVSAAFGLALRYRRQSVSLITMRDLLLFGICVHVVMLCLMFSLPDGMGWTVVRRIGPHVLILFPVATVLIGKILSDHEIRRRVVENLRESNSRFRATLYGIGDGVITVDRCGYVQWMNPVAEALTGWTEADARDIEIDTVYNVVVERTREPVRNALERAVSPKIESAAEPFLLVRREGGEIPISDSCSTIRDESGANWGVVVVFHDQTAARRAEIEALEKQRQLQMIFDAAQLGTWEIDLDSQTANRSLQHDQIFGYPDGTVEWDLGRFLDHVHPDEREFLRTEFKRSLKTGSDWNIECRIIWADLSIHRIWGRGSIVRKKAGRATHMLGVVCDVTEQYLAGEQMRRQEALLRIASRVARLGGWRVELADQRVTWSDEVCAIHGVPAGTVPTLEQALNSCAPSSKEAVADAFCRCARDGISYDIEVRLATGAGDTVWVRSIGEAERDETGEIVRVQGALQDISERKQFENSLSESEKRFRQLADAMPLIVWTAEPDGNVDYANRAMGEYSGLSPEESAKQRWLNAIHPDDMDHSVTAWLEASQNETNYSNEFRLRRSDGTYRWQAGKATPVRDDSGRLIKWFGTLTDIHDNRLIQEEMRQLASRLTATLESITDAFFMLDGEWRFTYANQQMAASAGRSQEELIGKTVWESFPEVVGTVSEREYRRAMAEQVTVEFETNYEPLGLWFEIRAFPSEVGLAVYCRDISARKRAEAERTSLEGQLRQSQKMEAVGRLAGGVAHDFNNMLSVILGYTDMLLADKTLPELAKEDLVAIHSAAERSALLTSQLLAFARKQTIAPKSLALNETVPPLLNMLRRLIGEDITLLWNPEEGLWPVKMDPSQLDQIMTNLIVNARDVIKGRGRILLETANLTFDEAYCRSHADALPGDFVMLAVSDDGHGMDQETLAQVFEPFFSTKAAGEGTGLGLATVYGIVKQNSGFITGYSEPEIGTTFRIYLPRHKGEHVEEASAEPVVKAPPNREETILLLEDEGALLTLGTRLLEKLGYHVLPAPSPTDALRIAEEYPEIIHLLMTDVIMPEMSGGEVALKIRALRPDILTLYVSGYTADIIANHGVLDEAVHFLSKPFTLKALSEKIREALGDPA